MATSWIERIATREHDWRKILENLQNKYKPEQPQPPPPMDERLRTVFPELTRQSDNATDIMQGFEAAGLTDWDKPAPVLVNKNPLLGRVKAEGLYPSALGTAQEKLEALGKVVDYPFKAFGATVTKPFRDTRGLTGKYTSEELIPFPEGQALKEYEKWEAPGIRANIGQIGSAITRGIFPPAGLFISPEGEVKLTVKEAVESIPLFVDIGPKLAVVGIKGISGKVYQSALNRGLDKWIASQGRLPTETQGQLFRMLKQNKTKIIERATDNYVARLGRTKNASQAVKQAVDDTIRDIQGLVPRGTQTGIKFGGKRFEGELPSSPFDKGLNLIPINKQPPAIRDFLETPNNQVVRIADEVINALKDRGFSSKYISGKMSIPEMKQSLTLPVPKVKPEGIELAEKLRTKKAGVKPQELLPILPKTQPSQYDLSRTARKADIQGIRQEGTLAGYNLQSQQEWLGKGTRYAVPIPKDGKLTIYRATPTGEAISAGDYVTTSRLYADKHIQANLGGKGKITSIQGTLDDLAPADAPNEFWYVPKPVTPTAPAVGIPRTQPGMPEAGLQESMVPEVAAREVFPAGKGKPTQISMDEQIKLQEARQIGVAEAQAELEGLKEWLSTEPATKLVSLIKKAGWYKGEVPNLTLRQYKTITGKETIKPNVLTPDKKHVRVEYALDEIATELGYADGDTLKAEVERAGESLARIKELESITRSAPPIETRAPVIEQPPPLTPPVETAVPGGVPPTKPPPVSEVTPFAPTPSIMGDLQNTDELIATMTNPDAYRKIANLPGVRNVMSYLNPSGVAKTVPEKAVVARAALREEGNNKAIGAFSKLEAVGSRDKIWGEISKEGNITTGELSGHLLDEVLTYRKKYQSRMTPEQKQWADMFHTLEDAKLQLLRRSGIEINELSFNEGGEYVGRRVAGRINPLTGEMDEAAFVGSPGPGRPGAHMGAEKTRYFKDMNEAVAQGFHYLPPDEALFLNIKGAYNRIADKQMGDWVLERIPWRTSAVAEELMLGKEIAQKGVRIANKAMDVINRAIRGEKIPSVTIKSIESSLGDIGLRNAIGDRPALRVLKPILRDIITKRTAELREIRQKFTVARERTIKTHFGEATVQSPAFAGKILTGPEAKKTADVLNKAFSSQYGDLDKIISSVNKVNSIGRYFMLAGDASPLLIQLITFAFRFPGIWGKSAVGFTKALFDIRSQAAYLAKNNDIIQKSRNLILSKGGQTEFTEAFRSGGIMQSRFAKAPKAVLEPFQRGFEAALDTAGIELRKAFDYIATTPQRTAEIEQFINLIRGVTSSARIGVSPHMRAAETAAILAPRYNRAIAALLSDIGKGGIRGVQARKALIALIGGLSAIAVAISLSRGEGWEGAAEHLDPRNSRKFLTWEVAGQNIGPGSKFRSVILLLGKIINEPERMVDHANNFLRGNFSPFVSTGFDIISGKDFIGEPTRPGRGVSFGEGMLKLTKRAAENFMPIWVQSVALEGGEIGQRLIRGVAEFLGGRAYPVSLYHLWSDDIKEYDAIPTDPIELKRGQMSRLDFRESNPDIDAKLFISGRVQTIRSKKAFDRVMELIQEKGVRPEEISAVKSWQEEQAKREKLGIPDTNITLTDYLIRQLLSVSKTPQPAPTSPTPQGGSILDRIRPAVPVR